MAEKDFDHDSMAQRDRTPRWALLIAMLVASVSVPLWLGSIAGEIVGFPWVGMSIGASVGVFITLKLFPYFWVTVPQTAAFVTTSMFAPKGANPNVPYGPGGHPAFPWEMRAESGNITLDKLTFSFKETVPTKSTAMIVDGTMQFKFDLAYITTVVGVDVATIEQGLIAQINEWLSDTLAVMDGDDARKQVRAIRANLEKEFRETRRQQLLEEYGVRVVGFQIASIDFPPKVQEVRDTVEEAKRIRDGVAFILGFNSVEEMNAAKVDPITMARAREDFLAASGNVKKDVRRIDVTGLEGSGVGGAVFAGMMGSDSSNATVAKEAKGGKNG